MSSSGEICGVIAVVGDREFSPPAALRCCRREFAAKSCDERVVACAKREGLI